MGQQASVMERIGTQRIGKREAVAQVPARTAGRAPLLDILTDRVVIRIAFLAVGIPAVLLAVAALL
jgi:hypothetical protein